MKTLAALASVLAVAATAAGQEFRGAITGRVNDKSGGVLPGVTVTATNVATNVSSTTVTRHRDLRRRRRPHRRRGGERHPQERHQ
jgi:hypothetical protein